MHFGSKQPRKAASSISLFWCILINRQCINEIIHFPAKMCICTIIFIQYSTIISKSTLVYLILSYLPSVCKDLTKLTLICNLPSFCTLYARTQNVFKFNGKYISSYLARIFFREIKLLVDVQLKMPTFKFTTCL